MVRNQLFQLVLVILSFALAQSSPPRVRREPHTIAFEDCGTNTQFELINLSITGCSGSPCKLLKHQTVTVTAEFQVLGDSLSVRRLTHEAYWILNHIFIKATITPESCEGMWCPMVGQDGFTFTAQVLVNDDLPTVRGTLYWRTKDENNNLKMCYRIPVNIN